MFWSVLGWSFDQYLADQVCARRETDEQEQAWIRLDGPCPSAGDCQ